MGKSTTKDRSKQVRTFDKDGFRKRADAIIFRNKSFTEVLLVSSRSQPDMWTVAGGGMDPNETGVTTCVREAREEAGVVGTVHEFVGSFDDPDRRTRTEVYIMLADRMVDSWEDNDQIGRRRQWFSPEDAISHMVRRPRKQLYLKAACKMASQQHQVSTSHTDSLGLPSPSSCPTPYWTTVLSLILTCVLLSCAGLYMVLVS